MRKKEPLSPLLDALRDLIRWLHAGEVQSVIIGGVAASILGRPRMTRDIDVLILLEEKHWENFLSEGAQFGFIPRLRDCLGFARKSRVLWVRHKPTEIDVDITFGALDFEKEAITHAVWLDIKKIRLPLPTPEDLIIMKAIAHRPRDVADIESILDAQPKLDLRRVRRWVKEFSKAVGMPEILKDLENVLARKRKKSIPV
jgi:predicted nucleotidyltransferase